MAKFKYLTSCVNSSGEEINIMKNLAGPIEFDTFYRKVDKEDFKMLQKKLGYAVGSEKGLHLKDDWHVGYFSSWYAGKECVFLTHSAIEYIFGEKDVQDK
jgi:hypothetical protein